MFPQCRQNLSFSDDQCAPRVGPMTWLFVIAGFWTLKSSRGTQDKFHLALEVHRAECLIDRLVTDNLVTLNPLTALGEW